MRAAARRRLLLDTIRLVVATDTGRERLVRPEVAHTMNIIPLGDRILVRRAPPETRGSDATAFSDAAQEMSERGVVVAVGSGDRGQNGADTPLAITAGDIIVFGRQSAQELTLDGVQYWIMKADEVLIVEVSAPPLWSRRR
jgi:chaperonin GroES